MLETLTLELSSSVYLVATTKSSMMLNYMNEAYFICPQKRKEKKNNNNKNVNF